MAKTKKKRTKRYTGAGSAQGPVIHRYEAVERSRLGQWLYERRGRIKIFGVLAAVAGVLTLLVSGISSLLH